MLGEAAAARASGRRLRDALGDDRAASASRVRADRRGPAGHAPGDPRRSRGWPRTPIRGAGGRGRGRAGGDPAATIALVGDQDPAIRTSPSGPRAADGAAMPPPREPPPSRPR